MATYSKRVTDLLANKDKLKKEALLFALIATGELKTPDEAKALIKSAENIVNRAGGEPRAMFYQYLLEQGRAGRFLTTREELIALQDRKNEDGSFYIPFSKDQKNKANRTHWLAIAGLVKAAFLARAEELTENSTYSGEGDLI